MSAEHPANVHSSESDGESDDRSLTGETAKEVLSPSAPKPRAAGKSKRQKRSSDEDDEDNEDDDEDDDGPSPYKTKTRRAEKAKRQMNWGEESDDEDQSPTKIKKAAGGRGRSDADYDDAYKRDVPELVRGMIHPKEWKFHLRELASAGLASRAMRACRVMESELAMKTSAIQDAPRNLSDLRGLGDTIGAKFGEFVSASFDIGSAVWTDESKPTMDKALFGTTMGKLLEAFINGKALDLSAMPKLETVSITGMRSATPPTDISLGVANPSPPTNKSTLKRKFDASRRTSSFDSPRSYSRSPKKFKTQGMSDYELRAQLTRYQAVDCTYDENNNLKKISYKNRPGVDLAGARFVTVPELIKLLLAEPWKAIAERPFAFRMLDKAKSDASTGAVFGEVKKSIEDIQLLVARWERQFRIQLPSSEDMLTAYPDDVDRQWIMDYRDERTARAVTLLNTRRRLEAILKELVDNKKVPKNIDKDPGLMVISESVIAWMPTTQRLLYDMALRTARDPSRFNSVFNPATHVFYREHLQYGFPVNPETPAYNVTAMAAPWPFTDDIVAKYPIDKWRQEAKDEWDFYQRQLDIPIQEPPLPDVEFPRHDEYAKQAKDRFKRTRYAYYHSGQFSEKPIDNNGNQVQVKKWDRQSQWIQQPIKTCQITMFDRDDPDSNILPPR